MGRAYQVRASSMAATAAKRSALFMRASKEIYMAAKSGVADPESNLALRAAIDKYRALNVTREVIDRAIKKAAGGEVEAYNAGRYEAFGPGGCFLIVDTLTDNTNRAISEVRSAITKRGGKMGSVLFNFTEYGQLVFAGQSQSAVEEQLILNDVDVQAINVLPDQLEVLVSPTSFAQAKKVLETMGVTAFVVAEITLIPNDTTTLEGENLQLFKQLIDVLDELQDVQNVYHNVSFAEEK
ncbi:MAG: YebC/PmpR family DNA-binding transcriptional regulator [Bacilli bacterium]